MYKIGIPFEEDIATHLVKILQLKDQLQALGKTIPYVEMTTVILNNGPAFTRERRLPVLISCGLNV